MSGLGRRWRGLDRGGVGGAGVVLVLVDSFPFPKEHWSRDPFLTRWGTWFGGTRESSGGTPQGRCPVDVPSCACLRDFSGVRRRGGRRFPTCSPSVSPYLHPAVAISPRQSWVSVQSSVKVGPTPVCPGTPRGTLPVRDGYVRPSVTTDPCLH